MAQLRTMYYHCCDWVNQRNIQWLTSKFKIRQKIELIIFIVVRSVMMYGSKCSTVDRKINQNMSILEIRMLR